MANFPASPTKIFALLAPLALLLLVSSRLYAQQPMTIPLSGSAEVPPVTTSAAGTGQITITAERAISGSVKIFGLSATMAHVHEAGAGKNGPPIVTLTKTGNDIFVIPPDTRLTDSQYQSYAAGNLYLNVHSTQFPDGEIRGQLPRPVY